MTQGSGRPQSRGPDRPRPCLRSWLRPILATIALLGTMPAAAQTDRVVWAWERTEALETLPADIGIAAVTGFIRLRAGAIAEQRGRRFPLLTAPGRPAPIATVHIEIDQNQPLLWSVALAEQVVAAAIATTRGASQVQIDMEVRQSQRGALLDVLRGVRAGLAPGTTLSMTALASWCDTEHWLDDAPVDEIVPMLFRMGRAAGRLRARLMAGGDFAQARCRTAVGISLDSPIPVPTGRRVYIFNPRPWNAATIAALDPG